MKKLYIKDIKERDQVSGSFLVTKKESGVSKSGKPYLVLRLMDSTGSVEARAWENAEALGRRFDKDDIVEVRGFAVSYQGGVQVNVTSARALAEGQYSLADFLPSSGKDPEEMIGRVDAVIGAVKDAHIRGLLESIFNDPDVRERFMIAPAPRPCTTRTSAGLSSTPFPSAASLRR
ncbi:MAG: OB-fold nucleic acid binding domain-containing protein [Thermodesulfobacteriota bacterium]